MFHNVKTLELDKAPWPLRPKVSWKNAWQVFWLVPARRLPVPCVSEQWQGNFRALLQDLQQRVLSGIFTRFPLSIVGFFPSMNQTRCKVKQKIWDLPDQCGERNKQGCWKLFSAIILLIICILQNTLKKYRKISHIYVSKTLFFRKKTCLICISQKKDIVLRKFFMDNEKSL